MVPDRRMRDDSFRDFVLDQLGAMPDLTGKAMFGGYGLYHRASFFGIVYKGRLFFKTNHMTQPMYRSRGMQSFRPGARQTLARYYEVPVDILEDRRELTAWAQHAAVPPTAQLWLPFSGPLTDTLTYADLSLIAGTEA